MTQMPTLTGSPKQVAWADKIRTKAIELLTASPMPQSKALLPLAAQHTQASWWIDGRNLLEHQRNIAQMLLKADGYMGKDGKPTEAGKVWAAQINS